jgi:hypothetical protein
MRSFENTFTKSSTVPLIGGLTSEIAGFFTGRWAYPPAYSLPIPPPNHAGAGGSFPILRRPRFPFPTHPSHPPPEVAGRGVVWRHRERGTGAA